MTGRIFLLGGSCSSWLFCFVRLNVYVVQIDKEREREGVRERERVRETRDLSLGRLLWKVVKGLGVAHIVSLLVTLNNLPYRDEILRSTNFKTVDRPLRGVCSIPLFLRLLLISLSLFNYSPHSSLSPSLPVTTVRSPRTSYIPSPSPGTIKQPGHPNTFLAHPTEHTRTHLSIISALSFPHVQTIHSTPSARLRNRHLLDPLQLSCYDQKLNCHQTCRKPLERHCRLLS